MNNWIRSHPVWSFLLLNYLISWLFLYPSYRWILESDSGIPPIAFIGLIGAYGPTIAAVVMQLIIDRKALRSLLRKLLVFRIGFYNLLLITGGPITIYFVAYLISAGIFDGDLTLEWKEGFASIPVWFVLALPFGPLGEELGWRGFLLPQLLKEYSWIKSTVLVGLAWGVWHLASFSFPGAALPDFFNVNIYTVLMYFVNTIALSFVFTFVHLRGRGSVFAAVILHASFNSASNIVFEFFPKTEDSQLLISTYIFNFILAAIAGYLMVRLYFRSGH